MYFKYSLFEDSTAVQMQLRFNERLRYSQEIFRGVGKM